MSNTVQTVAINDFINALAKTLKNQDKIKFPEKFQYCKTGVSRQYAPLDADWYFVRAAAVLRRLYLQAPMGLTDLKRAFGKELDGTAQGCHFKPASGAIIQSIVKQLDAVKYTEQTPNGRKLTKDGERLLNETAKSMK